MMTISSRSNRIYILFPYTHLLRATNHPTAMHTPPIVSPQEWEAEREQLLVKEKARTRARDALAAERRRMPWLAVEKDYVFEGPEGGASLLELFEGRRDRKSTRPNSSP